MLFRSFTVADQRSLTEVIEKIEILPCKEIPGNDLGHLISDRMPKGFATIFIEHDRCAGRVEDLLATDEEFKTAAWSNAAVGGIAPTNEETSKYLALSELEVRSPEIFDLKPYGNDLSGDLFLEIEPVPNFNGKFEELVEIGRAHV